MSSSIENAEQKNILTQVKGLLESGTQVEIRNLIHSSYPTDTAHVLESLDESQRKMIWNVIPPNVMGEILIRVNTEVGQSLLKITDRKDLIKATENLGSDDMADLLHVLPEPLLSEVMEAMGIHERNRLESTLEYDEHTAGGLMSLDVLTIRSDVTLDVVVRYLRKRMVMPSSTDNLIVVDRADRVQGVLSLSNLLIHDPESKVSDAMDAKVKGIPYQMSAADVAIMFEQRQMLSAPVVRENGRLMGRITIDDVVGIIREKADYSIMSMAGLDEEQDMFAPVMTSAKRRAVWLGINLVTAFLASWVIGLFAATLEQIVALAVMMPIVASMGGIAGSQTLTLVVRGLALRQVSAANASQLLIKEFSVGIVNGITWATVVAVIASIAFQSTDLGITLGVALVINLVCASIAGAGIPLILDKLGIDPALAGGVLLTTVTDCIGFLAFLGLATVFLL
ncbi:MAG: magnesium transporter [Methylococcales symbiont of Hymedesmia sp. n. MRB-2018]|nr:MAG: magnesium transporter [Methylococcales symbiont of Hymedesmia sp. n. MRB-2018]KAF3984614.1 MAG: magnesium transporter [Methylococcales symbiont of Hymedesmia sp. n. MRB-2018]